MEISITKTFDAGMINCHELISEVNREMKQMHAGEVLEVIAYDLTAVDGIPAWCRLTGNKLLASKSQGLLVTYFYIEKN